MIPFHFNQISLTTNYLLALVVSLTLSILFYLIPLNVYTYFPDAYNLYIIPLSLAHHSYRPIYFSLPKNTTFFRTGSFSLNPTVHGKTCNLHFFISTESFSSLGVVAKYSTTPVVFKDDNGDSTCIVTQTLKTSDFKISESLNLFGLNFTFDGEMFKLSDLNYTPLEVLEIANKIDDCFITINQRGYIPKNSNLNHLFVKIHNYLKSVGYKSDTDFGSNENSFTLWFNFIRLNLYYLTTNLIQEYSATALTLDADGLDLLSDLEVMASRTLAVLDPYLRVQLQKRGITFMLNTYTGFDTEYTLQNEKHFINKLISIQLAVQARVIIKVPMYNRYDIAYIHPLTSELTSFYKPKNLDWINKNNKSTTESDRGKKKVSEMNILNASLKSCVDSIRVLKYPSLDKLNHELIELLHGIPSVISFEDVKKDQIIFVLPLSKLHTYLGYPPQMVGYTLRELVKQAYSLSFDDFITEFETFTAILNKLDYKGDASSVLDWFKTNGFSKPRGRTTLTFNNGDRISFTVVKKVYLVAHYNSADLSMLNDFDEFKQELSIVLKSFVTLGKPLEIEGNFVYIRDTHLLTPASSKGLEALGKLYDTGVEKKSISTEDLEHMDEYLSREPKLFEEYAIQDAIIPLTHAITLEGVNFTTQRVGVPITLSSLSRSLVLTKWSELEKHFAYQVSGNVLMGNANEVQTPKGLFSTGDVGLYLGFFIGNYKGGRNESFMYGSEDSTLWFDYDLSGAYTTAMTHLSLPAYGEGKLINSKDLLKKTPEDLLHGYYIMNGSFKFPDNTKYPSVPCYLDESTTVYPLRGNCILTGPEYLLARNQKCEITIKSVFYIPPTTIERKLKKLNKTIVETVKPFYDIVDELQAKRREYPKGHVLNALYKQMANSIYGNVVRGISNKKSLDTKTGSMIRMSGTELSNPILASWTTAFIRSVVGECLHNIKRLGGKVLSVTTDGFITDLTNLEPKLLNLPVDKTPLFRLFRALRITLTEDTETEALELKNKSRGVISWSTRGQLGLEGGIKATTGFQSFGYSTSEMVDVFKSTLAEKNKMFEYTQKSVRSAKDVFNRGGHVTVVYKDQKFRLIYDNRRVMIEPKGFDGFDMSDKLFDSNPHQDITGCANARFLSKFYNNTPFLKTTPVKSYAKAVYKSGLDVGVRCFIKGYLAKTPCFGLRGDEFQSYVDLINFILGFDQAKGVKISRQSISNLKRKQTIIRPVPRTRENIAFSSYIKQHIPHFCEETFLKI